MATAALSETELLPAAVFPEDVFDDAFDDVAFLDGVFFTGAFAEVVFPLLSDCSASAASTESAFSFAAVITGSTFSSRSR